MIRNQLSVRRYMYTDHEITTAEHQNWLDQLKKSTTTRVFCILKEANPAGIVSFSGIDEKHKKCDWAFFLDENERGGLGAALEFAAINYVFSTMGLEKLNCEVLESNESVVKMHQKFGFEREGFRRSNIEKDGARIGVHLLGITRSEWSTQQDTVTSKYKKSLGRFSVIFEHR